MCLNLDFFKFWLKVKEKVDMSTVQEDNNVNDPEVKEKNRTRT